MHGELIQKGYATSPILKYNRKNVVKKSRLKEWDYYLIYNDDYAVALTLGRSKSLLLISATLIDLLNKRETTKSMIRFLPNRKLSMPLSSKIGDLNYRDNKVMISFLHRNKLRVLYLHMKDFANNSDLDITLRLSKEPKDSMVIATPFQEDTKAFYYNQKIIGTRASGSIHLGDVNYTFNRSNSFGLIDWGRGVWPYKTTWYWSAAQGTVSGNLFGFNLGYGFGDTTAATENMLLYNGTASKLNEVNFHIPKNTANEYDYSKPWSITSSDNRFEMIFEPILDRTINLSLVLISTKQHQVFGKFTGMAILDDGTIVMVKDFMGFIEHVQNRW
jgi:hypothetical protein